MKIIKKIVRYKLTFKIRQFPWALQKMLRLRRRKWARIKFSRRYLIRNKIGKAMKYKLLFKTYKEKTKKIFKRFFAPQLNARQFKKLFRSNPRYKSTLKRVLNMEYRLDTLVYRLFMFSDINVARDLIANQFFLVNKKLHHSPHIVLSIGDMLEPSHQRAWKYVYENMLQVTASLQKYLNRLFFKFSFPFVLQKKKFRLREYGKYRAKKLRSFTFGRNRNVKIRTFFNRFLSLKKTTKSNQYPRKVYTFFPKKTPKHHRQFIYALVLKARKNNAFLTRIPTSYFFKTKFQSKKRLKFRKLKKTLKRVDFLKKVIKIILKLKKKKYKKTLKAKKIFSSFRKMKNKLFFFKLEKKLLKIKNFILPLKTRKWYENQKAFFQKPLQVKQKRKLARPQKKKLSKKLKFHFKIKKKTFKNFIQKKKTKQAKKAKQKKAHQKRKVLKKKKKFLKEKQKILKILNKKTHYDLLQNAIGFGEKKVLISKTLKKKVILLKISKRKAFFKALIKKAANQIFKEKIFLKSFKKRSFFKLALKYKKQLKKKLLKSMKFNFQRLLKKVCLFKKIKIMVKKKKKKTRKLKKQNKSVNINLC